MYIPSFHANIHFSVDENLYFLDFHRNIHSNSYKDMKMDVKMSQKCRFKMRFDHNELTRP